MSEAAVAEHATDDESFDDFVAARGAALWRTAWLLTGDHHRAEDLVQTALGKAWPHWRQVHATGSFEAYTRRIMFTTYLAWWRRKWNGELPSDKLPEGRRDPRADDESRMDLHRDLVVALESLPKGQRAVVVLRYFEDLTEAQTAETLGISIGTVKSQTARALQTLRSSPALAETEGRDHD
jgi:RNA polymerase sigma-70 factor (sigma-E family)